MIASHHTSASLEASRRQIAAHYAREDALVADRKEKENERRKMESSLAVERAKVEAEQLLARAVAAKIAEAKRRLLVRGFGSMDEIIVVVADHFSVPIDEMLAETRRNKWVIRPRQIAMYLANTLKSKSQPQIGKRFGRDHTTVLHAVRSIAAQRRVDLGLNADIVAICLKLTP